MDRYGVMNEEKSGHIDNSEISHIDIVADRVLEKTNLTLYLKVTDSDIRTIEVNPNVDTVASLKSKVRHTQGFWKELAANQKVRLIFNGRIMLDNQNLIIYSEVYTEFTDRAYIHAVVNEAVAEDPKSGKKEAVKGFDKLESSGFNVDDIHNLRFHFHAMCIYTGLNKEEEEEKFKLEEDWLDGKLPQINSNLRDRCEILLGIVRDRQDAQLGDGVDFVWGLMLGIVFSFFVLMFV